MIKSAFDIDGADLARVSMDGVAIVDGNRIVRANDELAAIHGADAAAAMVGRKWTGCYELEGPDRTAEAVLEAVGREGEWRGPALGVRRDGTDVPVELSLCTGGDCLVCLVAERPEREDPDGTAPGDHDRQGWSATGRTDGAGFVETLLDAVEDVVYVVDDANDLVGWNGRLNERLGYTDGEIARMSLPDFLAPEDRALVAEGSGRMVDLPDRTRRMDVLTKDGERIPHELTGATFRDETTGERYRAGVARDVSGRVERERRLERYERIVETVDDGVYVLDEDLRVETANERFFEMLSALGRSREEVRNVHAPDLVPRERDRAALEDAIEDALGNEPRTGTFEVSGETPDGDEMVCESRFRLLPAPEGEHRGCVGVLRDITERKERERDLRAERRFNRELVENAPFSIVRIDEEFRITYVNPRTEEVTGLPEGKESEALGVDIRELPSVADTGQADRFTPLRDGETVEFEFPFESLYGREVYFTGRGVPIVSGGEFAGAVLMAVDISERRQHEKDLERQRDELDTLNRINELLLAVARDLFESPMQEDIERTVCTRLANSDLYRAAWIGKPEASGNGIVPEVWAGVDDDALASTTVTTDGAAGRGAGGRAFRTGTVRVSEATRTDPLFEPWRDAARGEDVRSVAAVPLTYDGSTYGILAVYASRPLAFSQRERRGFEMLGEAVGYAINANRTRQLLFAERVVELELRVTDPDEFLVRTASRLGRGLSLESYVSTRAGTWLLYLATESPDPEAVLEAVRADPGVESVRTIGDGPEFVLAVTAESALLDTIAALGGTVSSASVTDGRGDFVVQVPGSIDASEFLEQFQSTYPGTTVLAKRDGQQPVEPPGRVTGDGVVDLTDRQRQALEAAYRAGYFEWPRENSAEDVAELLAVSRPTFQAHLRKAENELLSAFFTGDDGPG